MSTNDREGGDSFPFLFSTIINDSNDCNLLQVFVFKLATEFVSVIILLNK
ncbi:hypothetical protein CPVG_00040, partial [Cyanophage KBS-S-1A]